MLKVRRCIALMGALLVIVALTRAARPGRIPSAAAVPAPLAPHAASIPCELANPPGMPFAVCYAAGTPPEYMAEVSAMVLETHSLFIPDPDAAEPRYTFSDNFRWNGSAQQGNPITLRWSFVPDNVQVENLAGQPRSSELFARMDALFSGNRTLWISKFQQCFDRWSQLSGITYQRVTDGTNDWDDGSTWGSSGTATRGDIRIGMCNLDGVNGVLAYNEFPGSGAGGNMVMDRSEGWAFSQFDFRFLRNVILHEHGHGLGLDHVCPDNSTKLMEPLLNENFDGPQQDDIRAVQRGYGDPFEQNNSALQAFDLGVIGHQQSVSLGPVTPFVLNGSRLSIDANGETDWFRFTVETEAKVNVSILPIGTTYLSGPENANGTCSAGSSINCLAIADLNLDIRSANGTTIIADAAAAAAGAPESLANVVLPDGPGSYFVRVYENNSTLTQTQLYRLDLTVFDTETDFIAPTPNPMTFATPPTALSASAITMTATTASDDSTPVEYNFEVVTGSGPNATPSGWQIATTYVDQDLWANRSYKYTVKARDGSSNENTTTASAPLEEFTAIETPGNVTFGTVTDTSIEVIAGTPTTYSLLFLDQSALFFEMSPPVAGSGANAWVTFAAGAAPMLTAVNLTPGTEYTFRVKARNRVGDETPFSPPAQTSTTGAGGCALLGDVNGDGKLDGRDILGFVRVKLGAPLPGDHAECADYGNLTLSDEVQDFSADLTD